LIHHRALGKSSVANGDYDDDGHARFSELSEYDDAAEQQAALLTI
jgi:hypothetical protein